MPGPVARPTPEKQLLDNCLMAVVVVRVMVVLQELGSAAVDADAVPFVDHAALPCRRVALSP